MRVGEGGSGSEELSEECEGEPKQSWVFHAVLRMGVSGRENHGYQQARARGRDGSCPEIGRESK